MVMDAALRDWRAPLPLPGGSKRLPIYPQIPAAAATGGGAFTAEELDSLLFLPSDGVDAGGYLMNASEPLLQSPPASFSDSSSPPRDAASVSSAAAARAGAGQAAHPDDSEAVSDIDIVLGYIDRMLMAEDIDEKFEHYPAHAALVAAERPFLEILADNPPSSAASTLDSPDSATNSCNSLSSCTCAAPPVLTPPALEFLQPAQLLYPDLSSPDSCVVDAAGAWPYDPTEFYQLQTNPVSEPGTLLSQSSSFASSNGSSSLALSEGFDSFLNTGPDAALTDFVLQSQQASQFSRGFEEGSRFLPQESKLVIDVDSSATSQPPTSLPAPSTSCRAAPPPWQRPECSGWPSASPAPSRAMSAAPPATIAPLDSEGLRPGDSTSSTTHAQYPLSSSRMRTLGAGWGTASIPEDRHQYGNDLHQIDPTLQFDSRRYLSGSRSRGHGRGEQSDGEGFDITTRRRSATPPDGNQGFNFTGKFGSFVGHGCDFLEKKHYCSSV